MKAGWLKTTAGNYLVLWSLPNFSEMIYKLTAVFLTLLLQRWSVISEMHADVVCMSVHMSLCMYCTYIGVCLCMYVRIILTLPSVSWTSTNDSWSQTTWGTLTEPLSMTQLCRGQTLTRVFRAYNTSLRAVNQHESDPKTWKIERNPELLNILCLKSRHVFLLCAENNIGTTSTLMYGYWIKSLYIKDYLIVQVWQHVATRAGNGFLGESST